MANELSESCMSESMEELVEVTKTVGVTEVGRKMLEKLIVGWRTARATRLEHDRLSRVEQAKESALMSYVIEAFRQQELEGMVIDGRISGLSTKPVATVSDKEALMAHIRASGELELLQFRLATGAVDERNAEGIKVPGVEYIDVYGLTDRKV